MHWIPTKAAAVAALASLVVAVQVAATPVKIYASTGGERYFALDAIPAFQDSIAAPGVLFEPRISGSADRDKSDGPADGEADFQSDYGSSTEFLLDQVGTTWSDVRSSLAGRVSQFLALEPIMELREALRSDDLSTYAPTAGRPGNSAEQTPGPVSVTKWESQGRSVATDLTVQELLLEIFEDLFTTPWPYLLLLGFLLFQAWVVVGRKQAPVDASAAKSSARHHSHEGSRRRRRRRESTDEQRVSRSTQPRRRRSSRSRS
ncbi:MAG: hypothetical protein K0U93_26840 [Gammaproteobacteria bacterium]|nr:hypothetical protein [Gammaproteobacteria bacterium]